MAKKLLEEATVRRFMKIAGLQPLSEGFVDKLEENEELEENTELEEGADLEEKEEKDKKAKKEKMEENLEEMYKEEEPGMEDAEAASEPEMDGEEEVEMEAPPEEMGDEDKPDSDVQGRIMDVIKQLADLADLELEMEEEGGEEDAADDMAPEAPEDMGDEEVMEEGEHMEEPAEDPAGHKLDSAPKVDDADSKDPNQDPGFKPLPTATKDMDGGKPVQESKDFREQLIEQVAKRVAAKLKSVKQKQTLDRI